MIIKIENVPDMTDLKKQEVGQALLITLAHHNIEINSVTVRFDNGDY